MEEDNKDYYELSIEILGGIDDLRCELNSNIKSIKEMYFLYTLPEI